MLLNDYNKLIKELPFLSQSFDIKKENWNCNNQKILIDQIFNGSKIITINRFELFSKCNTLKEFIIKTLMWGYPIKGRGKNIDNILEDMNFNKLIEIVEYYKENNISSSQFEKDSNKIRGIGISTMTKFAYFLKTTINGKRSLILDLQLISIISSGRFEEFNHLKTLTYDNSFKNYDNYLITMNNLSDKMNVKPDQIEYFLFTIGRNLSELSE